MNIGFDPNRKHKAVDEWIDGAFTPESAPTRRTVINWINDDDFEDVVGCTIKGKYYIVLNYIPETKASHIIGDLGIKAA